MREAYSHEVISHGFWPGSGPILEPSFYAYAAPAPPGLENARVQPAAASYHREMGEFLLPYEAVRTAASPDEALLAFVQSTYDQAATLAKWDRAPSTSPSPCPAGRARMDDEALVRAFEAGEEPAGGFHHAQHVHVAWWYLRTHPLPDALKRFSESLRRFAVAQGKPTLYHETVTVAFLLIISERLADGGE